MEVQGVGCSMPDLSTACVKFRVSIGSSIVACMTQTGVQALRAAVEGAHEPGHVGGRCGVRRVCMRHARSGVLGSGVQRLTVMSTDAVHDSF